MLSLLLVDFLSFVLSLSFVVVIAVTFFLRALGAGGENLLESGVLEVVLVVVVVVVVGVSVAVAGSEDVVVEVPSLGDVRGRLDGGAVGVASVVVVMCSDGVAAVAVTVAVAVAADEAAAEGWEEEGELDADVDVEREKIDRFWRRVVGRSAAAFSASRASSPVNSKDEGGWRVRRWFCLRCEVDLEVVMGGRVVSRWKRFGEEGDGVDERAEMCAVCI